VFDSEFIEGLPLLGRSYQDILTLAPGVTDVDGDGNPNVNGARDVDMQTRLDGANVTDPFSGTYGQNLNLESIGEIEMITTGASAEFGQAQGGFANVVTKSGSNEFEGSAKLFFRADLFDNDGANNNDVSDRNLFSGLDGFEDFRPFVTLGGPIMRDRLWYFVALEYLALEEPVNTLTFPALRTEDGWNNFGKVTWQATPEHRLSMQLNYDPRRFTGLNVDTRTAPESDYTLERSGYSTSARWTWTPSPSILLETMISRLDTGFDVLPGTDTVPCLTDAAGRCDPFTEDLYTIDVRRGLTTGPYYQTSRDSRDRLSFRADLSAFIDTDHGNHQMKTGVEVTGEGFEDRIQVSRVRFDDFSICLPPPEGRGGLGPRNLPPQLVTQSSFDCDPPPEPGEDPKVIGSVNFEDAVPGDTARSADKEIFALYAQDTYKPLPNLTLGIGVRLDREAADTDGWESFDPAEQANEFLDRLAAIQGLPQGSLSLSEDLGAVYVLEDLNGDGRDGRHCYSYDLDGAGYGDGMPDGVIDDFFTFFDGDYDGTATPGDPDDIYEPVPDGIYDGRSNNPACDRVSEDVLVLFAPFSRHQADQFNSLFISPLPDRLYGTQRTPETISIVNNNVAPRLSLSWDPWGDNRTKVFATWGRYFDRLFLATLVPEQGPDARTQVYLAVDRTAATYARSVQSGRFSIHQVDRGIKTPFTDELTLGFERELAPEWALSMTYIHRTGRDQLQDVDVNHYTLDRNGDGVADDNFGRVGYGGGENPVTPEECLGELPPPVLPPSLADTGAIFKPQCHFATTPDGQPDLFPYNPFFNQVLRVGNFNSSSYESIQVVLGRRLSRNWQMTSSYVYSRALGDAEEFLSGLGNDPGTIDDEFGPLSYDQTHVAKFSGTVYVPHDQSIGATILWASGTPYSTVTVRESADQAGSFFLRTTYPTGQRNDQRNEGVWRVDLAYRKSFNLPAVQASVGVEVTNLLNSDDVVIYAVEPTQLLGLDATRRFGRRWQLSMALHF